MVFDLEGIGMVRMEFDHACSLDRIVKGTGIFKISGKILSKEFNGLQRIPTLSICEQNKGIGI